MVSQTQELTPAAVTERSSARTADIAGKRRIQRRQSKAAGSAEDGLPSELHLFIAEHPGGWNHDEWVELLGALNARGYDTTDSDTIGLALERARLDQKLTGIAGLGDRRRATLLDRYARLWDLQQAGVDEIARLPGLNAGLARRIMDALR